MLSNLPITGRETRSIRSSSIHRSKEMTLTRERDGFARSFRDLFLFLREKRGTRASPASINNTTRERIVEDGKRTSGDIYERRRVFKFKRGGTAYKQDVRAINIQRASGSYINPSTGLRSSRYFSSCRTFTRDRHGRSAFNGKQSACKREKKKS